MKPKFTQSDVQVFINYLKSRGAAGLFVFRSTLDTFVVETPISEADFKRLDEMVSRPDVFEVRISWSNR